MPSCPIFFYILFYIILHELCDITLIVVFYCDLASEVSRLKIKIEKLTDVLAEKEKQIEDLEKQLNVATSKSSVSHMYNLHIVPCSILL